MVAAVHALLCATVAYTPLLRPLPPPCTHAASRVVTPRCAESSAADEVKTLDFDTALNGILADAALAKGGSMDAALEPWLERIDENFIPTLASKIEVAPAGELPRLNELMLALQQRSQAGFERARDQLQTLLGAGELNKMDAQIAGMVKRNEVDAGLFYVILRNMQDAQASGDETGTRLLQHIHSRLQEELEKKTEPALALLHKLTRMEDPGTRANILRHNLVPQTETLLPDGTTLPLANPAPASVEPMALADAIDTAINKVLRLPIDRVAIEATAEEIRQVAKEARAVIEAEYEKELLDEFTDKLTPAFAAALPAPNRPTMEPGSEVKKMEE